MEIYTAEINTCMIPQTLPYLMTKLPSVLKTQCFNDKKLPFMKEVRKTEMGHLFEHILLEYLCMEKMEEGATDVVYNGVTWWDWQKEQEGSFHIQVDCGLADNITLAKALGKTILLVEGLYQTITPSLSVPLQQLLVNQTLKPADNPVLLPAVRT